MKRLAVAILALLFGTSLGFAHEMNGGSTEGLFGLKAEYLHELLNPLPVYGLSMGVLVLVAGLLAQSKTARNIGLGLIAICSASAWPVLYFGQHGYNHLYPQLDPESQQWLSIHMERAEHFIYAFYMTALFGLGALTSQRRFPKANNPMALLTLGSAMACLGIGGWISRAGGQVSHSEFREEGVLPPSVQKPAHDPRGDKTQMTNGGSGHQHEAASQPGSEKAPTPDTVEGVWKAIHEHYGELESGMNAKQFQTVQTQVGMLGNLITKLFKFAQPAQQTAIASGASKIARSLDELKSSAETGSETVMTLRFKEFSEALKQVEEQMKKQ